MELREKIQHLPERPGVYLFKNSRGDVIYIGKAVNLRSRVRSYFSSSPTDIKTTQMLSKAADLEFVIVDNESEALLLESNLVKQYRPRYNVNLKDDKRYPYLHITDEPFPRIEVVRTRGKKGLYFGPYTDVRGMRSTLALIRQSFRLRSCKHQLPRRAPKRACLNRDIGRCDAPCQKGVSQESYAERVEEAVLFLKGRHKELVARLSNRMDKASAEMDFEYAAHLRDQLAAIESVWKKQKIDTDLADRDIHAIAVGPRNAVAVTMQVREGRVIARQEFHLNISSGTAKAEVMSGYLTHYYSKNINPPKEILVSVEPTEAKDIAAFVSDRRASDVELHIPMRGQKRGLIKLVERNAELLLAELIGQRTKVRLPFGLIELQKELRLKGPPRLIEAIDISHIAGKLTVGSLVTFRDGKKYSRGYRRYRINDAEPGDDYAAIYELVSRRVCRLKDEGRGLPDLMLIDGGKGQLAAAAKALEENDIAEEIELASIAKRLEEIFRPGIKSSIMLPKDSAALRILVKIRNEAHRFAVEYQRKRRTKAFRAQELATIRGIGPKRQKKLLNSFDSLEKIANSEPEEIAERASLPLELAEKVVEALSSYKNM